MEDLSRLDCQPVEEGKSKFCITADYVLLTVIAAGTEALSEFGARFFKSLHGLEKECSRKRSEAIMHIQKAVI